MDNFNGHRFDIEEAMINSSENIFPENDCDMNAICDFPQDIPNSYKEYRRKYSEQELRNAMVNARKRLNLNEIQYE